ncbi:transposase [Streptomyces collinus]|uniref:transposase n=1 Tax=Streptomyces collinus TaxID=42684 RepID=UPI0037AE4F98
MAAVLRLPPSPEPPSQGCGTRRQGSRVYGGAKKNNGRKRHLVVETGSLPLFVLVARADMTDREAAKEVLFRLQLIHPKIAIVWADSGYAGQLVAWPSRTLTRSRLGRTPHPSPWRQWTAVGAGQRLARIITVRTGEAGDGWLCPMSSYPHDL